MYFYSIKYINHIFKVSDFGVMLLKVLNLKSGHICTLFSFKQFIIFYVKFVNSSRIYFEVHLRQTFNTFFPLNHWLEHHLNDPRELDSLQTSRSSSTDSPLVADLGWCEQQAQRPVKETNHHAVRDTEAINFVFNGPHFSGIKYKKNHYWWTGA